MSLEINKQSMKYASYGKEVEIYEKDDDGNIKYFITEEGQKIPLIDHKEISYEEPVSFRANISFSGGEAQAKEYGFDVNDFDAIIVTDSAAYPIKKSDIIWLDSKVEYTEDGYIDKTSADFTVVGVKPALQSTKYVLKAVVK